MGQVHTNYEFPELSGPIREPTSWLTWLAEAFQANPQRFQHLHTVWRRAVALRDLDLPWLTPAMADRLELAALLHDVGRALDPHDTEPHGFVGARFLDELGLDNVSPLVAHHSGARFEAAARGMSDRDRWVTTEPDLLAILTFLDRTTSATGAYVSLAERRHGIVTRHGEGSLQLRIFEATMPEVRIAQKLLTALAANGHQSSAD